MTSTIWVKKSKILIGAPDEKSAFQEEMTVTITGLRLSDTDIRRLNLDEAREKHAFIRIQIEMDDDLLEEKKIETRQAVQTRLHQWAHRPNQECHVDHLIGNSGRPQQPDYENITKYPFIIGMVLMSIQLLILSMWLMVSHNPLFLLSMLTSMLWPLIISSLVCLPFYLNYHYQLWRWEQQSSVTQNSWLLELNLDNIPETEQQLETLFPSNGPAITDEIFSSISPCVTKINFYLYRQNFEMAFNEAITISDTAKQVTCLENLLTQIKKQNNQETTKKFEEKIVRHIKTFDIKGKPQDVPIIQAHMKLLMSLGRESDARELNQKYQKKFNRKDAFYFKNEILILESDIEKIEKFFTESDDKNFNTQKSMSQFFDEHKNKLDEKINAYKSQLDNNQSMTGGDELLFASLFKRIFDMQFVCEERLFQQQYILKENSMFFKVNSEDDDLEANQGLEENNKQEKIPFFDFLVNTKVNCEQKIENNYFKSTAAKQICVSIISACQSRLDTMMFENPNADIKNGLKNSLLIELYKKFSLKPEINSYQKQQRETEPRKTRSKIE